MSILDFFSTVISSLTSVSYPPIQWIVSNTYGRQVTSFWLKVQYFLTKDSNTQPPKLSSVVYYPSRPTYQYTAQCQSIRRRRFPDHRTVLDNIKNGTFRSPDIIPKRKRELSLKSTVRRCHLWIVSNPDGLVYRIWRLDGRISRSGRRLGKEWDLSQVLMGGRRVDNSSILVIRVFIV